MSNKTLHPDLIRKLQTGDPSSPQKRFDDAFMHDAFEKYRIEHFGACAEYPIDAFTYFAAGWKAAQARS